MTRNNATVGVKTDYCHDEDIARNRSFWMSNDSKANQRFYATGKRICTVPGGLDGDDDALFYQVELINLVAEGILPEGIRCLICGELHEVVTVKRSIKIRKVLQ